METVLNLQGLLVESKSVTVDYPGLDGFKLDVSFLGERQIEYRQHRER